MQSLDIISINLWDTLVSLANLLILFLVIKKFLFAPIRRMLDARQAQIDESYTAAKNAQASAEESKNEWDEKMLTARQTADDIIKTATQNADRRGDAIVAEAKEKADYIMRQAEADAELERQKAKYEIKYEIVNISAALAEKMLSREINQKDHEDLISSFIDGMGEE